MRFGFTSTRLIAVLLLSGMQGGCGTHASGPIVSVIDHAQKDIPTEPKLKILISGAKSDEGVYSCALFGTQEDFQARERPVESALIAVKGIDIGEAETIASGEGARRVGYVGG